MVAGGARLVDVQGKVIVNNAEGMKANQRYIDLFGTHKVAPPSAPTEAYAQVLGAFQSGNTAMFAHHVGSSVLSRKSLERPMSVSFPSRRPIPRSLRPWPSWPAT